MSTLETRITIFDRRGNRIAEMNDYPAVRNWVLPTVAAPIAVGMATFSIARTDPKCTQDILQYGNRVLIEHNRIGDWVGFFWSRPNGRMWANDFSCVTVFAYSMEQLFYMRRVNRAPHELYSPAAVFSSLIGDMNASEDTGVQLGYVWSGGTSPTANWPTGTMKADNMVTQLMKLGGGEYGFEVDSNALNSGSLVVKANWYQQRGQEWNVQLEEGKNIEMNAGYAMVEAGDIYNDVEVYSTSGTINDNGSSFATDTTSRAAYGLSQDLVANPVANGNNDKAARRSVNATLNPRKTYTVTATDVDNTFDYLGLGDTLWLNMPSVDFGGTYGRARVMGKAFDDETGACELTLDMVQ